MTEPSGTRTSGSPATLAAHGLTRQGFIARSVGGIATFTSLGALLAACGDDTATTTGTAAAGKPPSAPTGSVAVALPGTPPSLDPTGSFSANDIPVTCNLFECLLAYDGKLKPSLATSYSVDAKATEWTFKLREGVTFHDGATFDADAVKANLGYYAAKTSFVAFLVGSPTKIATPDPMTVVVTFKDPFPDFGRYMSIVKIISPKLLDGPAASSRKRINATPYGTGPFKFVRRDGNDVVATGFADHWGGKGPYFKDAVFKVVPDASTRISALEAGDVDLVTRVPPPTAQGLEGKGNITVAPASGPTLSTLQLSLASARPPFDDVRVRQALAYAMDRQGLLNSVFLGKGEVTGTPLPPAAYGFHKPSTQYGHDPERAKSLLKEAGHTGPVKFSMVVSDTQVLGSTLIQAIAQMANEAGFSASYQVVDQGVQDRELSKLGERKYDVFLLGNGYLAGSALHFVNLNLYSQYTGKELLDAIAKMNSVADGSVRLEAMAATQEIWARELPVIPMWADTLVDAHASSLLGYTSPIDGFQPLLAPTYRRSE